MSSADDPTLDILVRHREFVRGIARALLADRDAAEDIVQQTWMAALKHAERGGEIGRSLLGRIARNFAFNRRRENRRREAREQAAPQRAALPSPAEIIATEDERRRVVDAVLELDEPFRSTMLLRYMREHTEAEVATKLGVPLETVRWRLKTARARLRVRLAEDCDAPRSARALLALADWSAEEAAAAIAAGKGLAFLSTKLWIGAAAGIAVVAIFGWRDAGDGAADVERVNTAAANEISHANDDSTNAMPVAVVRHSETADAAKAATRPLTTKILGRCVTQQNAAVAGATVSSPLATAAAVTDENGRFALEVDATRVEDATNTAVVSVAFAAARRTSTSRATRVTPGATVELGDVELALAGTIRGIVLDEADRPLAARLHIGAGAFTNAPWWTFDPESDAIVTSARSDATGTFAVDALEDGFYSVVPSLRDYVTDGIVAVGVTPGQTSEIVVRMRPAPDAQRVRLAVVDEGDVPVRGIAVLWTAFWESGAGNGIARRYVWTDADGECSLVASETSTHAFDVTFADGRTARTTSVVAGGPRIVLRPQAVSFATIHVVDDATGAPCAGARVETPRPRPTPHDVVDVVHQPPWHVTADAAGIARVPIPPTPFELSASHRDYETAALGPFAAGAAPGVESIRLRARPLLRGSVSHAGMPVADALVVLVDPAADTAVPDAANGAFGRTRSDGSFAIPVAAALRAMPTCIVVAEARGFARARLVLHATELATLLQGGAGAARSLDVALTSGGTVDGRVTTSGVRTAAGLVVIACSDAGDLASTRVAEDGTYRLEHVRAGRWRLCVANHELNSNDTAARIDALRASDVQVDDRQVVRLDLAWVEPVFTWFEGVARFGAIARYGTTVHLRAIAPNGERGIGSAGVDLNVPRSGAFRGRVGAPGRYALSITVDDGAVRIDARREVDLVVGANALTFDPPCGSIAGVCAPRAEGEVALRGRLADGTLITMLAMCAPNGSFTFPFAPAGRFTISGGAADAQEIDVSVGATTTVELK